MVLLAWILAALLAAYLVWEKVSLDRARASFRAVIHVNGIRGKTGTCRMIDAHLRGAGWKVFTKTTGSDAAYIGTDGIERPVRRCAPASIREQIGMMRMAARQGAEAVVIECMAVRPELQRASQERIVRGDLNVITNVRYDHIFEMGDTKRAIAESLAGTIPTGGTVFTADPEAYPFFSERAAEKGSECVLCRAEAPERENEAIAKAVCARLGVPGETFEEHMKGLKRDFGTRKIYRRGDGLFLNLFSVNDPESTETVLRTLMEREAIPEEKLLFLYHHRPDRPDRLLLFIRYFFPLHPAARILVTGEGRAFAARTLKRSGFSASPTAMPDPFALGGVVPVGIGNIKGDAAKLIERLEGGEDHA